MTRRLGRARRVLEWLWRRERMRELRALPQPPVDPQSIQLVQSARTLAWRTLRGLEPVPARARALTARPLLLGGIERALRLQAASCDGIQELFDAPTWLRTLENAGILPEQRADLEAWLLDKRPIENPEAAERGLLLLDLLFGSMDGAALAVRAIRWRRLVVVTLLLAMLAASTALLLFIVTPPEGRDLGINKPWRASSAYVGYTSEGRKPDRPKEVAFFCTNEDDEPWWQIDLQSVQTVGSLTLVNRSDCCAERATPLVIEVSRDGEVWREVARRTETFRKWHPELKPARARFVRLRALRRTYLHMKDVRIQAPPAGK